jgi:hypothetical protein
MIMRSMVCLLLTFSMLGMGCMGRNALSAKVLKFNLETAESRWGREALFVGLNVILVYPITMVLDLLVINSIEFWKGENPINGKSPLLELPMSEVKKMAINNVESAQVERLTANEAKLHLKFENGDKAAFDIIRDDMEYTVSYRGVEFYKGTIEH